MGDHIFLNYFWERNQYLNQRQIASSCAVILEKEYKKIKSSLKLFSEVAALFNECNFLGNSNGGIKQKRE